MSAITQNVKIAVALRTGRAAIGWNQQEFADALGVAKSTIARIETLDVSPKAELLIQAVVLFRNAGLEVDLFQSENLSVVVTPQALEIAEIRLMDEALRRSDRKGPLTMIGELMVTSKHGKPKG